VLRLLGETYLLTAEGGSLPSHSFLDLGYDGPWEPCDVEAPAFSAASEDPVQRRFASIDEYFQGGDQEVREPFTVEVFVRDKWTGKEALLWNASYLRGALRCFEIPVDDPMKPYSPEGSRRVEQA
jgi:hypothetical protein